MEPNILALIGPKWQRYSSLLYIFISIFIFVFGLCFLFVFMRFSVNLYTFTQTNIIDLHFVFVRSQNII